MQSKILMDLMQWLEKKNLIILHNDDSLLWDKVGEMWRMPGVTVQTSFLDRINASIGPKFVVGWLDR